MYKNWFVSFQQKRNLLFKKQRSNKNLSKKEKDKIKEYQKKK